MGNRAVYKKTEAPEKVNGIYRFVLDTAKKTAQEIYEKINHSPLNKGLHCLVTGPERSGKSIVAIELYHLFKNNNPKKFAIAFCQPKVNRTDVPKNKIFSRSGQEIVAFSFSSKVDIETIFHDYEIVILDEIQFTHADLQSYLIQELELFLDRGGCFVGIGLNYTSQGGEFVLSALLKTKANKIYSLQAICQMCGQKADKHSQRLINGIPASQNTPILMGPSISVSYEPRCDNCFIVKK